MSLFFMEIWVLLWRRDVSISLSADSRTVSLTVFLRSRQRTVSYQASFGRTPAVELKVYAIIFYIFYIYFIHYYNLFIYHFNTYYHVHLHARLKPFNPAPSLVILRLPWRVPSILWLCDELPIYGAWQEHQDNADGPFTTGRWHTE